MANVRVITSLLDYTPTASSEDSTFPVTNLLLVGHLRRPWKATTSGAIVNVTLDLGAGNTLSALAADPGIFLDDVNVTSLRIQGNSVTTDWVTPPWDQAITVAKHKGVARYKDFRRLADLNVAAFAYRYLNIRFPAQSTTDGAVYRIGRAPVGHAPELATNYRYDSDDQINEAHVVTPYLDGGGEYNIMGPPLMTARLQRRLPSATAIDEQWDLDALGIGTPFVLWDAGLGGTQDGWLVRRTAPSVMQRRYLNHWLTTWEVEEVI